MCADSGNRPGQTILATILMTVLVAGCGPSVASSPGSSTRVVGRTSCPGAVLTAMSDLTGTAADAVEALGTSYGDQPGVLAVVYDGSKPILIVERQGFPIWSAKLAGTGVSVAPSCIDPDLLAGLQAVVPELARSGVIVSAGYDGLDDAIVVSGGDPGTVISAVENYRPGLGDRAQEAIRQGTLRVDDRAVTPR
jgi:hypothetical protein